MSSSIPLPMYQVSESSMETETDTDEEEQPTKKPTEKPPTEKKHTENPEKVIEKPTTEKPTEKPSEKPTKKAKKTVSLTTTPEIHEVFEMMPTTLEMIPTTPKPRKPRNFTRVDTIPAFAQQIIKYLQHTPGRFERKAFIKLLIEAVETCK